MFKEVISEFGINEITQKLNMSLIIVVTSFAILTSPNWLKISIWSGATLTSLVQMINQSQIQLIWLPIKFLVTHKSIRSVILLLRCAIGWPVDAWSSEWSHIVKHNPHWTCCALNSPPAKNCGTSDLKWFKNYWYVLVGHILHLLVHSSNDY